LFRYHQAALDILFVENQIPSFDIQTPEPLVFQDHLQLKNIAYRYPNAQKSALHNINLHIPIHSTIGFVGMSGAGKTTLIDILLGLLQPSGELIVDGTPITTVNVRAWQQHIGYVPQNIFLADASIACNIALGIQEENINHEAVVKAAKLANLDEFITTQLPQGYDTFVGEKGIRLSGGQRQRIGIARALYHDPELLIFDEATSALDGVTEKVIIEAINKLAKRKTILLIAHRLNTVKDCDVIYVLKQGEIVGQGNYNDLLMHNQNFQHLAHA
jgi:ABC-type multidrug transport system fused ATPase/permease subunit